MGNDRHRLSWSNSEFRSGAGFTLIEVMVVLVIMGLFVGLVSTIVRPDDRALLRLETERLAQLLDLAATESRLTGKRIAWTAEPSGYRFWRFSDDTEWSEINDVDSLRPRMLPAGMKIAGLRVENALSAQKMRLEFTPFGATLSFAIALTYGVATLSVEGSPIGEITIVPDERKKDGQAAPR
jgi:general secretion pathway protein H